jgi:outer membrane autotransporter protein
LLLLLCFIFLVKAEKMKKNILLLLFILMLAAAAKADIISSSEQMSGYFLANVIKSIAADKVYDKIITRRAGNSRTGNSLWAQVKGGAETFESDDNAIGAYKDAAFGVMFGFDKYTKDNPIMWGVYARFSKHDIEQEKNSANAGKNGLGLYGGYIKDSWELKAELSGSYDIFDTQRAVMGQTAKAGINAFTINAGIESALKYDIGRDFKFKPNLGIELQNANYENFKEKDAGTYNLEIKSDSYIRSAARIGAEIEFEKEKIEAYAKAQGEYLLSESASDITDTQSILKSKVRQEGKIGLGFSAGTQVKASENIILYADVIYYMEERYSSIYANLGVKHIFGKEKIKKEPKKEKRISIDDIIMEIAKESQASLAMEARQGKNEIIMRREADLSLGTKKSGKVYIVNYGKTIFLFKEKPESEKFIEGLRKLGIKVSQDDIKETEGVYIKKGKTEIKQEPAKEKINKKDDISKPKPDAAHKKKKRKTAGKTGAS